MNARRANNLLVNQVRSWSMPLVRFVQALVINQIGGCGNAALITNAAQKIINPGRE
jgi:hypothetical protein